MSENPKGDNLRPTIDKITALISLSHTIRVFSVKWQLIRKRLEELYSGLIALENTHCSSHDRPIVELVALVHHVVDECHDLGSRYINVSYSGKLLMQSDLDKVFYRLDLVLKRLMGIYYNDGVVHGGLSLVVSRPVNGSSREDMRFYVKDLLNRLKIGDCKMKKQALSSLNEVICDDEKYVKIIVDLCDFVLMLVSCLDSNDLSVQEEAVIVIGAISGFDSYKGVLVNSGVIAPLIRVLEIGSLKSKEYSIKCLIKLTENADNAWALSAHGGVTALLNVCSRDNDDDDDDDDDDDKLDLIGPSCWVLRNVVVVEEIKRFMIDEGAIGTFIKLINGRNEIAQIGSCEFLQSLASGDETVRGLVIKEGCVRALVRIVDPKSTFSFKLREAALKAVENLCFSSMNYVNLLITYGFMDQLLYFLRNGDVSIQELAFKSASRLCGTSEEARKSMGEAGFMAEFIKFLEGKSYHIREMAAEALSSMVTVPRNRKKFSNDDYNIGIVLQKLDPKEGNCGNFKFLLSILLSLSNCNHSRKIISHSKYVKNIDKLAEAGITDAKKIMRKLSANRFKTLLNGIWHS